MTQIEMPLLRRLFQGPIFRAAADPADFNHPALHASATEIRHDLLVLNLREDLIRRDPPAKIRYLYE